MNSILAISATLAVMLCVASAKAVKKNITAACPIQIGPLDTNITNLIGGRNDSVMQRGLLDDLFGNGWTHSRPRPKPQPKPKPVSSGSSGSAKTPSGKCGVQATQPSLPTQRIIGGQDAVPHSWPWLAAYQVSLGNGMGAMCGANLIRVSDADESDVFVTAAHCVTKEETMGTNPEGWDPSQVTIIAGINNKRQREAGLQGSGATEIRFHPEFRFTPSDGAHNDVALVKLSRPVKFTDTVTPICLPDSGEAIPVGKTCVAAGWGRVDPYSHQTATALQQVVAPAQDPNTCADGWGRSYDENQMICAGELDGQSGTCQGDSGGMLACQDGGVWKLYGTTSFGLAGTCLGEGKPGNFARISSYVDWINQNAQDMTSVGK